MIQHNILRVASQKKYALSPKQKKVEFQSYTNTLSLLPVKNKTGHMFKK